MCIVLTLNDQPHYALKQTSQPLEMHLKATATTKRTHSTDMMSINYSYQKLAPGRCCQGFPLQEGIRRGRGASCSVSAIRYLVARYPEVGIGALLSRLFLQEGIRRGRGASCSVSAIRYLVARYAPFMKLYNIII